MGALAEARVARDDEAKGGEENDVGGEAGEVKGDSPTDVGNIEGNADGVAEAGLGGGTARLRGGPPWAEGRGGE